MVITNFFVNLFLFQWVDEIMKHLKEKSIRMLVYKGVAKQSYIQPNTLANFDIVISTYETLSRELNYVDLPHSNSEAGRRYCILIFVLFYIL